MRKTVRAGLDGYRILQLKGETGSQIMGYLFLTPRNRVIVIDGGVQADADVLLERIMEFGTEVDAWILTHAHDDHIGAFTKLLMDGRLPPIGRLYYEFPPLEWLLMDEDTNRSKALFFQHIPSYGGAVVAPKKGMSVRVDGAVLTFLTELGEVKDYGAVNDTSIVCRIAFGTRKALFLADLSAARGAALLAEHGADLKSDIVQMAHHGQSGVLEDVYGAICPELCLWPTPGWLWENNAGGGPGSGPWTTLETREWVARLPVKENYVSKDAEYLLY